MDRFSPEQLEEQRKAWREGVHLEPFGPFRKCPEVQIGSLRTADERVGSILLAGGQGTRLGFDGPKGIFPVGGKSLFQHLLGKIDLPDRRIAIMTSPLNHRETVSFFEKHGYFGLGGVRFFQQETLPLLDEEGRWFFEKPGKVAEGPDGNGSVFRHFVKSGLADWFEQSEIDVVQFSPIDNPLALLFDSHLIDFHRKANVDVTVKCVRRKAGESMGALVERKGRLEIVEYTELGEERSEETDSSGDPAYGYANTGQFAMSLSFVRKVAEQAMPLHWARKQGAWKAERFIFDALRFAEKAAALCYPRPLCYAPLKDSGAIAAVEKALSAITGA